MARIGVLIAEGFEDSEYSRPAEAFKEAGHELLHIGLVKGVVKGKKGITSVEMDKQVKEVSVGDLDAVLIPGGHSPDRLRTDENMVLFSKEFLESGKPMFVICHGPQLLITADALRGRRLAGYRSIVQDIKNAGAEFVDEAAVVDGNLVTSRDPGDMDAFIAESLKKLR